MDLIGGIFFHIHFDFSGIYSTYSSKYSSSMTTADISLHISGYFSILGRAGLFSKLQGSGHPSICLFTSESFILGTAGDKWLWDNQQTVSVTAWNFNFLSDITWL